MWVYLLLLLQLLLAHLLQFLQHLLRCFHLAWLPWVGGRLLLLWRLVGLRGIRLWSRRLRRILRFRSRVVLIIAVVVLPRHRRCAVARYSSPAGPEEQASMLVARHWRERPPSLRYSRDHPAAPTRPRGARLAHSYQKSAGPVRARLLSFLFWRKYREESPRGLNCLRLQRVFLHPVVPAQAWLVDPAATTRPVALPETASRPTVRRLPMVSRHPYLHEAAVVAEDCRTVVSCASVMVAVTTAKRRNPACALNRIKNLVICAQIFLLANFYVLD